MKRSLIASMTSVFALSLLVGTFVSGASAEENEREKVDWPDVDPLPAHCPDKTLEGCGGDVVGTWKIIDGCHLREAPSKSGCPKAKVDRKVSIKGEMTFAEDGKTKLAPVIRSREVHEFPCSCVPEKVRDSYRTEGTTCRKVSRRSEDDPDQGTYRTKDNALELEFGGGTAQGTYCVDGDKLQIHVPDKMGMYLTLERAE